MDLDAQIRSYARTLNRRIARRSPKITTRYGTVTAVATGSSVTVTVEGNSLTCPYRATYSPVVGHFVQVEFHDGSPIVLDRVYGVTSA